MLKYDATNLGEVFGTVYGNIPAKPHLIPYDDHTDVIIDWKFLGEMVKSRLRRGRTSNVAHGFIKVIDKRKPRRRRRPGA